MKYLIYLLLFSFIGACNSSKNANTMSCATTGVVKDFSGLDGCGLLIELADGSKLEPAEIVDNFKLKDGQRIAFDYEELSDMMSICMAGRIVRITCIREEQ